MPSEMGNSDSGVEAFLLGVGVEFELVLRTLELEWSFENIDRVGLELELKFLIRYGVGMAYHRSCPSLVNHRIQLCTEVECI